MFSYKELPKATEQFRPKQVLSEGRIGMVYKGKIHMKDNRNYYAMQVAIKKLAPKGIDLNKRDWVVFIRFLYFRIHFS